MDPIAHLILAAAVFLGIHFVPSSPARPALVKALGEGVYTLVFSLASLALIVWLVYAYNQAPQTPLWPGLRFLPAAVMPFAFVLVACGVLSRNPTAVAQGRLLADSEPARGIIRVTRHPVMWGIMLWSGAHLLARGELAATIFFGGFLVLAAWGTRLQDARKAKTHGEDWKRFAALTSNLPFAAIAQGRNRFVWSEIGLVRVVFGLLLYGGVFHLHATLFGPRPY
jgi:uncharacterized membrane protein